MFQRLTVKCGGESIVENVSTTLERFFRTLTSAEPESGAQVVASTVGDVYKYSMLLEYIKNKYGTFYLIQVSVRQDIWLIE